MQRSEGGTLTEMITAAVGQLTARAVGALVNTVFDRATTARSQPTQLTVVSAADRLVVYRRFRHACLDLRSRMQTMQASPVGLLGLVTTVPAALGMIRDLPQLATELSDAALDVQLVGPRETIDAASKVVAAINTANGSKRSPGIRRKTGLSESQKVAWRAVDDGLSDFIMCVRAELGIEAISEDPSEEVAS